MSTTAAPSSTKVTLKAPRKDAAAAATAAADKPRAQKRPAETSLGAIAADDDDDLDIVGFAPTAGAGASQGNGTIKASAPPMPKIVKEKAPPKAKAPKKEKAPAAGAKESAAAPASAAAGDGDDKATGHKKGKKTTNESKLLHICNIKALANASLSKRISSDSTKAGKAAHTGQDATRSVRYYGERFVRQWCEGAKHYTAHAGRKQIKPTDMQLALEDLGFEPTKFTCKQDGEEALKRFPVTRMAAWRALHSVASADGGQASDDAVELVRYGLAIFTCMLVDAATKITMHTPRTTLAASDVQFARRNMKDSDTEKALPVEIFGRQPGSKKKGPAAKRARTEADAAATGGGVAVEATA